MKKYIYISLAVTCLLASCSKDNTPLPEPFKVTKITCTKNGSSADGFSLTIQYDNSNKNVSLITDSEDGVSYNYQYRDNKIYVLSNVDDEIQTEYTLSGNRISDYLKYAYNPYNAYERYERDKYSYKYSGYYWIKTEMESNRLDETGKMYNHKVNDESNKFNWEKSNITQYTVGSYYSMIFTYSNQAHPINYPFRILNCIPGELAGSLIRKENFSPLNLMMGNNNKNLLEKAQWYKAPEINTYLGEYFFRYDIDTYGYVTEVYVTENINNSDGSVAETNDYVFTLTYGYDPN